MSTTIKKKKTSNTNSDSKTTSAKTTTAKSTATKAVVTSTKTSKVAKPAAVKVTTTTTKKGNTTPKKTPTKRKTKKQKTATPTKVGAATTTKAAADSDNDNSDLDHDNAANSDSEEDEEFDYFSFKSDVNKTSNHNFSNSTLIEGSEIAQILDRLPEKHLEAKKNLIKSYVDNHTFREMFNDLKMSYNLLLSGYGSKKDFIQSFLKEYCTDGPAIQIYGYLPSFNIKDRFTSPILHCEHIKSLFDMKSHQYEQQQQQQQNQQQKKHNLTEFDSYQCLYIVIHNIDGVALRNAKVQRLLAYLSEITNIHFICSIDHFNSYMLWDINLQVQFNFITYSVPTYSSYTVETAYEVPLMNKGSKIQWKSIVTILKSLPPNARGVFKELLEYIIANKEQEREKKMPFNLLFEKCVDSFLVSSESMLNTLLVEFNDHGVIQTKLEHAISLSVQIIIFKLILNHVIKILVVKVIYREFNDVNFNIKMSYLTVFSFSMKHILDELNEKK
ncbi:origin recognition complex subunit 2 [Heterostelium album PN500]|uniref:Origin recognition complex subunit 2 n=1 Tax=Heterostelium pallidum (strain ATCC 26659 / Pp 5 / PN500) TaxID=670386 RepID=D3B912_HETP5|nr:origin recognition complex subunit 2 [Heterostelium album PN500]EFA82051.1 origin recognition complex subunit 2 [Heterostelium album PN500]|eukprot:XP_020434168.1 origin recognition complex subunit 2 [Heterostelium album PN500]